MNADAIVSPITRWYVVFNGGHELSPEGEVTKAKRRFLVDWLSPRGFWHCFAFAFDAAGDRWIVYEVNRHGTAIVALTSAQFDIWLYLIRTAKARVLSVDVKPSSRFWLQIGLWCTVAARHTIGAKSRALRPVGLWRDLRKQGAKEVFV